MGGGGLGKRLGTGLQLTAGLDTPPPPPSHWGSGYPGPSEQPMGGGQPPGEGREPEGGQAAPGKEMGGKKKGSDAGWERREGSNVPQTFNCRSYGSL